MTAMLSSEPMRTIKNTRTPLSSHSHIDELEFIDLTRMPFKEHGILCRRYDHICYTNFPVRGHIGWGSSNGQIGWGRYNEQIGWGPACPFPTLLHFSVNILRTLFFLNRRQLALLAPEFAKDILATLPEEGANLPNEEILKWFESKRSLIDA